MSVNTQQQQEQQEKKPKERFQEILLEIFNLIETCVPEGIYLEVAEQLKLANEELNELVEPPERIRIVTLIQEVRTNRYYKQYVKNKNNDDKKTNQKLSDADKMKQPHIYTLCQCGRFYSHLNKQYILEHLSTHVHYQCIRNKKYSAKKSSTQIDNEVFREINLNSFCIKHLDKIQTEDSH